MQVVLVCRKKEACAEAAEVLRSETKGATNTIMDIAADFADLIAVSKAVSVLHKEKIKVDVVVLNAAVVDPTPIKVRLVQTAQKPVACEVDACYW